MEEMYVMLDVCFYVCVRDNGSGGNDFRVHFGVEDGRLYTVC